MALAIVTITSILLVAVGMVGIIVFTTFYAYLSGGSVQFPNSGIIEMVSLPALGRVPVRAVEFLRRG